MADYELVEKIRAIHGLIKTELPIAAGVCVVAGMVISGQTLSLNTVLLGFAVGFFLSGTAMMTNDYWDLEVDKINHPDRPLPSGRITVNELKVLAVIFSVAGLSAAAILGLVPLVFSVIIWVLGLLYNWRYKETGLTGNMMVSFSVASTFILGGVAAGGVFNGLVWVFGGIAFFFDLAEEIAGGAMDAEGDAMRGVQSIARVRGREFALRSSALIFGVVIFLTFLPYVLGWLGSFYLVSVVVLNAGVSYLVYKLLKTSTPAEGRKILRLLYISMMVFVLVFIVSSVAK